MLFNTFEYFYFLPLIILAYYLVNFRYRWMLLLAASYYFYAAWDYRYIVLIIISTLIDYLATHSMVRFPTKKKFYLMLSLISNLSILIFFKYYNFLFDNTLALLETVGLHFDGTHTMHVTLAMPIGLSFYTFQTLSYTIDVYRGQAQPEKHLGKFALYVSYFPQLVAGPIERAKRLIPQLYKQHRPNYLYFREGAILILWGIFKKVVIGDRLGYYVTEVFNAPNETGGMASLLAIIFFSIQIYCDFSAYSDIARGSSLFFGIKLMENFRRPFLAKSTKELISRWHISLTQWFRDYLYFSLGGSNTTGMKTFFNLFVVWSLTGLWHGANWTYVITAQLNCLFLIVGRLSASSRRQILKSLGINSFSPVLITLDVIQTFMIGALAMTFFRAHHISEGYTIIQHAFSPAFYGAEYPVNLYVVGYNFHTAFLFIFSLFAVELIVEKYGYMNFFYKKISTPLRWSAIIGLIFTVILFSFNNSKPFIYFQF